jgi:two-component sensor histidine kinase
MNIDTQLLAASWRSWLSQDNTRVGPYWLQLLWTLLFSMAVAVGFTIVGALAFGSRGGTLSASLGTWLGWYGKNLVVSLCVGFAIHGLFELFGWWLGRPFLRRLKGWGATLYFASVPMLGLAIGWPLGIYLAFGEMPSWLFGGKNINWMVSIGLALLISLSFHFYFTAKAKQIEAEKRASEAQLRLLQAQMEPHFLFNTLANVQSLIDHEPQLAKQMLESFTDYLRATLEQLRREDSTVAQELALAESYLRLLATRMDERLRFTVQADERARSAVLPTLLLQPLVENAIHHGLEPQVAGGTVQLSARLQGQALVLEVRDDGAGPQAQPRRASTARAAGAGVALDNLRERLQQRYGNRARFELTALSPGTLARITLPFEAA